MSISLYEINNKFTELFEKAENEELTCEELQTQGNELAIMLRDKSTSIIGYFKQLELTSSAIDSELKRLSDMKKVIDNRNDKLKEYVKENMINLGLEKIETSIGILTIAKNPASVEITDETLITNEYKKEKITISIDKVAIKNDIKAGKNVQGARLIEDKTNLRIK